MVASEVVHSGLRPRVQAGFLGERRDAMK